MSNFSGNCKTYVINAGDPVWTSPNGCRSIDLLYEGTSNVCTFTGNNPGSVPVHLPPNIPYSFEFNEKGWQSITVDNTAGNGQVNVVVKQ